MSQCQRPQKWLSLTLGELTGFQNGFAFKSNTYQETGAFVIRIGNVQSGGISLNNPAYVDAEELGAERFILCSGDILISLTGNVGRIAVIRAKHLPAVLNQRVARITPFSSIDDRFIYYLMQSNLIQKEILESAKGAAQLNISTKDLVKIEAPLPPLAEQKVIADKLDTLLAQVENTKARLERIPQILKRFRQSVLAAAVSGRLTEEWRSNSDSYAHANADDWKWPPIPRTWEVKLYPDLVESRLGKMLDKAKNSGLPTKYLGNINVRWFDFKLSEVQEILVSEAERAELAIRSGDVLICEGGEPGRCAIWDGRVEEQIVFQKALHRARVSDELIPEWLALNLKHDADRLTLEQLFTGTTIKHLTGKALKKYPLRVPPIAEQTEIFRRVDKLFDQADRIEQQVNNALSRVNSLTQSILAKAFRGELTEQWRNENPELVSGENSAEALLNHIQAERATAKPAEKTMKRKAR